MGGATDVLLEQSCIILGMEDQNREIHVRTRQ